MNKSLKVGRLGAKYCWRIGSLHPHAGQASSIRGLQKRHYADRFTIEDQTQARIDAANKYPNRAPRENPWRDSQWSPDFPKRLDEIGYESHCNDRLYIAKNKQRHTQQEYEQRRLERRLEAQQRVQNHFEGAQTMIHSENRRRFVMQDPSEHQKRQEQIIEMNRRRWQSRPEAKREINNSGITYRPEIQKEWKDLVKKKSEALDRQRSLMRSRGLPEAETTPVKSRWAEAEDEDYPFVRGPTAEAEDEDYPFKRPPRAQREEDYRVGGQREEDYRVRSQSLDGLQTRLKWLMERSEAETRPEAEVEDNPRVRRPTAEAEDEDYPFVRGPTAEAEDEDYPFKRPPRAQREEDYRVRGQREEDYRVGSQSLDHSLQERLSRLMERAEAESNPEAEQEGRGKSPRAEAEDEDYPFVRGPRAEAEHEDWGVKSPRAEAEDRAWRVRSRRAEAEDKQWRLKSRRDEDEDDDWRVRSPRADAREAEQEGRGKSPRAEAEDEDYPFKRPPRAQREEDYRVKGRREEDYRVRSQSLDSGLQSRLQWLMERSEAETRPEAEDEDTPFVRGPTAEAEEAEKQGEAKDYWKKKNLSTIYDPNRPSEAWLKKKEAEQEAQYWHTWHTCPANREAETTVELKPHNRRKKVVVHPPTYSRDGQRRGYHQLVPPTHRLKATTLMLLRKRRPNGIEQQYHKFARQQTVFHPESSEAQPKPMFNAEQMPKPYRVIPKKDKKKPKRKGERLPVEPPRFRMTIRSRPTVTRKPAPVASYSRRLNIPPEVAGPSFYMANLRSSVCEAWRSYAGSYAQ